MADFTDYTALQLIEMALEEANIFSPGDSIPGDQAERARIRLNFLLQSWGTSKMLVYSQTVESFTLIGGHNPHTFGSGGDLDSMRPHRVLDCWTRYLNVDYHAVEISEDLYNEIPLKNIQTRPFKYYYKPDYPLGKLNLYPVPDQNYQFFIKSIKPFEEVTNLTDVLALPPQYPAAIYSNLALLICNSYGREPSSVLVAMADASLKAVKQLNLATQMEAARMDFAPRRRPNIYAGM